MSTVTVSRSSDNAASLAPSLAHALAVAARKPAADSRDDLAAGCYEVCTVVRVVGTLSVGHDSEVATSVTPNATELLALVLSKLNTATRAKVLRELPTEFAAAGNQYPEVAAELVCSAEKLCEQLRRKVQQKRRGSVTGKLSVTVVEPSPAGLRVVG